MPDDEDDIAPAEPATPTPDLPKVVGELYAVLGPLGPDDRRRVVQAAFALLGDPPPPPPTPAPAADAFAADLPADAQKWLARVGLTRGRLDEFFQLDAGAAVAFALPGSAGQSSRGRTQAAYLLQGVAALLRTGKPTFGDDDARQLCKRLGCYDEPNHSKYVRGMDNQLIGSKRDGYTLTQPGLAAAADLLKA